MHLLPVAVGFVPCSLITFLPNGEQSWLVLVLLKSFSLGHRGSVCRSPPPPPPGDVDGHDSSASGTSNCRSQTCLPAIVYAARRLAVVGLRVAEQPAGPVQPVHPPTPATQLLGRSAPQPCTQNVVFCWAVKIDAAMSALRPW